MSRRRMAARRPKRAARGRGLLSRGFVLAVLAVAVLAAGVSSWLVLFQSDGPPGPPRAVIVDQLSLTFPNPDFREEATGKLEQAGYEVDYIPGEEVTVDFYRDLPKRGYDLLIIRAHAGRNYIDGEPTEDTSLFTGEPYSDTRYLDDQLQQRLRVAFYEPRDLENENDLFFAVPPAFVRSSMKGDLDGATVILMGCDVLRGEQLAGAFVERGAATVVGWDDQVSASHTDAATSRLLDFLVGDGLSAEDAVAETMAEVGADPVFGAELLTYLSEG